MKIRFSVIMLAILFSALVNMSCGTAGSDDWVVKIDDEAISVADFENYYYTQNKLALNLENNDEVDKLAEDSDFLNPQIQQSVVKANFLDNLIAMKLLQKQAMEDKDIDRKELDTVIDLTVMQMVGQYYMSKKFKDEIEVSDSEVDRFYKENRELFKGIPMSDSVVNKIKNQIFMQKSSDKSKEYVLNLLAEHRVSREGFKKYMKKTVDKPAEETGTETGEEVKSGEPAAAEK